MMPTKNWRGFGSMYEQRTKSKETLRPATIHRAAKALEVQQSFLRQQLTKEQGKQVWDWISHKAQGAENGCPEPAKKQPQMPLQHPQSRWEYARGMGKAPQLPKQKRLFACLPAENPL